MANVPPPLDLTELQGIERTCTYYNVRRATRVLADVYDRALRPHALQGTQFSLLVAMALVGEATIGRLASVIGADRTTLSRSLAPLERDGLVASEVGADRRQRRLSLTRSGIDRLSEALPAWRVAQRAVVDALGPETWSALVDGARAVRSLEGLEPPTPTAGGTS